MIEDEEVERIQLKKLIAEIGGLTLLGEASDCKNGRALIKSHPEADLLLLDVELPDGTAFDLIEQLDDPPRIIFITNYEAYALRAFEINALDYIQKPLTLARLESALERLGSPGAKPDPVAALTASDLILLTENRRKYFTRVENLLAIQSDENYTQVACANGKLFVMKKTLTSWEAQLPPTLFRKVGRSLIVNLPAVDHLEEANNGGLLWFKNRIAPLATSKAAIVKLRKLAQTVS